MLDMLDMLDMLKQTLTYHSFKIVEVFKVFVVGKVSKIIKNYFQVVNLLKLGEVPRPVISAKQVLVKVILCFHIQWSPQCNNINGGGT